MSSDRRTSERPLLDVLARGRLGADRRAAARAQRDDPPARREVPTPWAAYVTGGVLLVGYLVLRLATA